MKILSYVFAVLIAIVPKLWIEDYDFRNPIWWTVVLTYSFGRLLGMLET